MLEIMQEFYRDLWIKAVTVNIEEEKKKTMTQ